MKPLKEQLKNLTQNRDKCETIVAYLKTVDPIRLNCTAVWQAGNRFLGQTHRNGEFSGDVFEIDIETGTLRPVGEIKALD